MKTKILFSVLCLCFLSESYASADLVHRYSFTNGDVTAVDSVGDQHGSLAGGALISNNAVQLAGDNDYVNLPGDLITGFTSVTLEVWFTYSSSSNWTRVFDFGDTNSATSVGRYYIFYTPYSGASTSRVAISDADPGYNHEEQVNASLPIQGVPVHIVCIYDGDTDTMSLYVNGGYADSTVVTIPLSAVDNVYSYLGRSLYPSDPYLQGSIDEFRIYNHVLTSEEILTNYNLGPDAPHAQYLASNPNPGNHSVGALPSTLLSWTAPAYGDPDSYTVYVSAHPDLIGAQVIEVSQGTGCAPSLDYDTTYYWRVDSNYGITYQGVVWTFTTCPEPWDRTPLGDVNDDFDVNILDLQWMVNDWLTDANSPANLVDLGSETVKVDSMDYALLAQYWQESASKLVINEFMANNRDYYADSNGDYDDWIEIYNSSGETIDLSGMYLTDDLDNPDKWQIPPGTVIGPYGHLIFWADEEEQEGSNHTNFKLDDLGEEIGLFDTDGSTLIDSVVYDDQYPYLSNGRHPDGGPYWRFFDVPTPLGPNAQGYLGVVARTEFSVDGGFYSDPGGFDVHITCDTPGATIYYTTNFTNPTESSLAYTGPIHIDSTACLRAVAFKTGWLPNHATSRTYIDLDDVMDQSTFPPGFPTSWGSLTPDYQVDPDVVDNPQYSSTFKEDLKTVPSICIVIPNDDLFGSVDGIYSHPTQRGDAWERKASIEIIDPVKGEYFQTNAGLRMHGGYARTTNTAKQSLRMIFRSIYGPSKLDFPLFEDSDIDVFDQLVLRATWNYSWTGDSGGYTERAQYMRELYAHDTIRDMNRLQGYGRHVHVYINGLYWGMYIFTERPDEGFASEHLGGSKSDYDVIKTNAEYWTGPNVIELLAGDRQAWDQLFALAEADLSTPEAYAAIQQYLDIPAMIDYMLMIFHTGSRDAPVLIGNDTAPRNFYAIRKREPGAGFVFLPWDVEWSLEAESLDRVNVANYINGYENPAYLTMKLKANEEFRMLMADHVHKHYFNNGVLTEGNTIARYWNRIMDIDRAIVGESARWGDFRRSTPYTRNVEWIAERNRLINTYFPTRDSTVLSQLRSAGLYPNVDAPVFNINSSYQHGGYVDLGDSLSMDNPNGSGIIYYTLTGEDPRLPASAQNQITLAAEYIDKRVLVPDADIGSAWRTDTSYDHSSWDLCTDSPGGVGYEATSGYQGLISLDTTEDMYGAGKNTTCYIRIPFTLSAEDLDGLNFMTLNIRYDDALVAYLNGNPVVTRNFTDTPDWDSHADNDQHEANAVDWDESIDISSYLGDLQVGDNLLAVHGMNHSPTSSDFIICAELVAGSSANDDGVSLAAVEYSVPISLDKSTHVKARVLDSGTWSALNEAVYAVGPVKENLRITELMYHPEGDPNAEFIEVLNIHPTDTIDLALVQLTNGVEFEFPPFPLPAGQRAVVVKDQAAFETRYGTGINVVPGEYSGSLSNGGEEIDLKDALGTEIHDFDYSDGWYEITDGLGFSLTIRDPNSTDPNDWDRKSGWRASFANGGSPGTDDSTFVLSAGAVVINELLANSDSEPTDWIELHNTTATPIDIGGWFLSDDADDLKKYEIEENYILPAHGYAVFYEDPNFGSLSDPGTHTVFAFNETGDKAYLTSGLGGEITGVYSTEEGFDATEADVALGRYIKSVLDGGVNFVAMNSNTPGHENDDPKVGPIVITEIAYHPFSDGDAEYVELYNISGSGVVLSVAGNPDASWRFVDNPDDPGLDYTFPSDTSLTLGADKYLLLVKDLDAFEDVFGVPSGPDLQTTLAWGIGNGSLSNGGEQLELQKPLPSDPGYYIRVDRVTYDDEAPWPTEPDGGPGGDGSDDYVLERMDETAYGNDVINWQADSPTPGNANTE